MKFLILALCVATALAASPELDQEWQMWKDTNLRKYAAEEEDYRRFVWEYNYKVVTEHNNRFALGHTSYIMAMNEYADMTSSEFTTQMNGFVMDKVPPKETNSFIDVSDLPPTVDWRTKGYVTGVKNQGQCGSCWSFSATGSLEGQTFNKTKNLVSISEQNLMDCATDPKYNCNSCEGGTMNGAFQYVFDNKGVDSESSYPYQAHDEKCRFQRDNVVATDKTHFLLPAKDEHALQKAVAYIGPISVAIDASHSSFQLYHHGVYDEPRCSQTRLDHGVLAVGYGMEDTKAYWLVKNSWGTNWGMKGYIMMSRFKNNQCGIATNASYPLV